MSFSHPSLSRFWLHLLGAHGYWSVPLKPTLTQAEQAQVLQPPLTSQLLQPTHHGYPMLKSESLLSWGPKTGCKDPDVA